jgi:hypothetical protein
MIKYISAFMKMTKLSRIFFIILLLDINSNKALAITPINIVDESGYIKISEQLSGAIEDQKRLARNVRATDFVPTGLYFPPNSTLKINVKKLQGADFPQLLIGTYARYGNRPIPKIISLHEGNNEITDDLGGLIYIYYVTDEKPNSKSELYFISGYKKVPTFILGGTTNQEWVKMLAKYDVPDVLLISQKIILVVSKDNAVKNQNSNQEEMLKTYDLAVKAEDEISGLDNSSPLDFPSIHKYLITESDNMPKGSYSNTANYRIAALPSAIDIGLKNQNSTVWNWGLFHELGHMHQQKQWTWNKVVESSVNVYTLAANRALGAKDHRFQDGKVWNDTKQYLQKDTEKDFNSDVVSVWTRLVMFEQLRVAFGDEFYKQLGKISRKEFQQTPQTSPQTNDDKMKWFMLKACIISKRDLTDFFKKWGFVDNTNSIYPEIKALHLLKPNHDITEINPLPN